MNPMFYIDFYKVGHIDQYHKDIENIYSTWTPRWRKPGTPDEYVHFGVQAFIKEFLMASFDYEFFNATLESVVENYKRVVKHCLFVENPRTDHIEALWRLRYLPLKTYSLPDGTVVSHGIPTMVITNTDPRFFWLVNYLETLMSSVLWKPATTATTARQYRKLFEHHAKVAGETDLSFVDWQGHDFSMRGLSGPDDATFSGMGHLLFFNGTDTVPAILAAERYYGANIETEIVGGSVPATEHSVMSAGLKGGEFETFKRLLSEVYPKGIVSVVSDTWDLWKVLTDYIPRLRDIIINRDGKLVIRPDSGDPVKIMIGDPAYSGAHGAPQAVGAISLLAQALGAVDNPTGKFPLINKGGLIYGDGISLERADKILAGTWAKELSPFNVVFGIGSYTYQLVTRDNHGLAMKAVAYKGHDGIVVPMFKDPVTDNAGKKSHYGIPAVFAMTEKLSTFGSEQKSHVVMENVNEEFLDECSYVKVFENSELLVDYVWKDVKALARKGL